MAAVLDGPVAAVEGQHAGGVGAPRGMAGDAVDSFGCGLTGGLLDGGTRDHEDLANAGKVEEVVEAGGGPDRALFDAAMGQGERLAEVGLAAALEDQADVFAQGRLVVFDGEDVVGVVVDQVFGELALGQQRVGGDGLAGDVEGFQQRDDPPDLVGLLDLIGAAYGQGADFFLVWQIWVWWPTTPRMWV